jgi:predicted phage terminase large subunit-like protein
MENRSRIESLPDGWLEDYANRRQLARTLTGFTLLYLPHYITLPPGTFHPELLRLLGDHSERWLEITGFRGSTKSTFGSLATPLWAALEHANRYQFIILTADTSLQAGINISNIKQELENNELIKQDYGEIKERHQKLKNPEPSMESDEEWTAKNMLLSNGVRILSRSRGQKIRGLRHRQHRPKLIIVDDPEEQEWVRTKENRDKTERWLRGEVIPALDETTGRLIVIGNFLHTDALMARLARDKNFRHFSIPLIDKDGNCTWPAKYPDQKAIELQRSLSGPTAFQREYLLRVVPEEGQIITEEDIQYYDGPIPQEAEDEGLHGAGVDLAISKNETADDTAIVPGVAHTNAQGTTTIYVRPPTNGRWNFAETLAIIIAGAKINPRQIHFVEKVGYQAAAIEELERNMVSTVPVTPGTDKRARLQAVAPYIKNGTVKFPRQGAEDLLIQLLGFGVEEHDDLVDALVYLINGLVTQGLQAPRIRKLI